MSVFVFGPCSIIEHYSEPELWVSTQPSTLTVNETGIVWNATNTAVITDYIQIQKIVVTKVKLKLKLCIQDNQPLTPGIVFLFGDLEQRDSCEQQLKAYRNAAVRRTRLGCANWNDDAIHASCLAWRHVLFQAVKTGDIDELTSMLQSPTYNQIRNDHNFDAVNLRVGLAIPNEEMNKYQWTCLHYAACIGRDDIVRLLLNCEGVEIISSPYAVFDEELGVYTSSTRRSPLDIAVIYRYPDIVCTLLDHGAIPNIETLHSAFYDIADNGDTAHLVLHRFFLAHGPFDCAQLTAGDNHALAAVVNEGLPESPLFIMLLLEYSNECDINVWYNSQRWMQGRYALYQFALNFNRPLPQFLLHFQITNGLSRWRNPYRPLLNFQMCCLHAASGAAPESALIAFANFNVLGELVGSFLLPSQKVRRAMKNVVTDFETTVNELDEDGFSYLRKAIAELCDGNELNMPYDAGMEVIHFLLAQNSINVNQLISCEGGHESCLRYALRVGGAGLHQVNAEIIAALLNAGGEVLYRYEEND